MSSARAAIALTLATVGLIACGPPPELTLVSGGAPYDRHLVFDGDQVSLGRFPPPPTAPTLPIGVLTADGVAARDAALDRLAADWAPPYDCYDCIAASFATIVEGETTTSVPWVQVATDAGVWPDDERTALALFVNALELQAARCQGPWLIADPGCTPTAARGSAASLRP